MKNFTSAFCLCILLGLSHIASPQVGINTIDPKSSLDITASDPTNPTNLDGILIPRLDAFPTADPGPDQNGMLVFLTQDITGYFKGFHYWDEPLKDWIPFATEEWKNGVNASGDDLIFAGQARTAGTDVVITDDGRIGFGTEDPIERFEFRGPGDNDFQITSANPNPPNLILYNTGGTLDAPAAFANANQEIGSLIVKTHDGTGIQEVGSFRYFVEGMITPGSVPTRFVIGTTPVGAIRDVQRIIVRSTGNVGLTEQNPTATLHIRPGTARAASAPLKFSTGVNLTTPEVGAMEYDGTRLYFTPSTQRQIVMTGYTNTATLDFPSITANNSSDLTVTVTGAALGDVCNCSPSGAVEVGLSWNCFVSGANVVTIRVANVRNSAIDPASRSWKVNVIK